MTLYDAQIQARMNQFQAAIETIAWGFAGKVIEQQRKRLAKGLIEVARIASKKISSKSRAKDFLKYKMLLNQTGTWSRGSGNYKVLGQGKTLGTYRLKNTKTNREITAVAKTLLSRWRHTP